MYTRFYAVKIKKLYAVHENRLQYGVGRAHHSDCSENSFIIAVYEKIFSQNFLSKKRKKNNFLIDNHYKTIFVSVRMACSSYRVFK